MGIFDALYTGVSGLNAAQIQIQTTGQNITNADSEYYTRQRVVQVANEAFHTKGGDIGRGTMVQQIVRVHDEFVFGRLTSSYSNLEYTSYKEQVLQEVNQKFPDLADSGILENIKKYFAMWNNYASHPNEAAQKTVLIDSANVLMGNINDSYETLNKIRDSVNDQLILAVNEVNDIARQIADINKQLQRTEINTRINSNDLRDKRDALELRLSKLTNINSFKQDVSSNSSFDDATIYDMGKNYTLSINGITLVEGENFHEIKMDTTHSERGYSTLFYELNDETRIDISSKFTGGKIAGMLDLRGRYMTSDGKMRDGILTTYQDNLDAFAKTFITQTNSVYASGAVKEMVSDYLKDAKANTTLQNYDNGIKDGDITVKIYNTQGNVVAQRKISINASTTLNDITRGNSIVQDFNKNLDDNNDQNFNNDIDDYFKAVYTWDEHTQTGNLSFKPTEKNPTGFYIAIEDNGTNFAGTLGLSKFLDGQNASNIRVNEAIQADPALLHGGKSPQPGDNSMANAMINLQNVKLPFNSRTGGDRDETISGYYRYITTQMASDTQSTMTQNATNTAINTTVNAQWQSISGVNMNEELSNLMRYQSSYGAAAKVITTVEKMLSTLLELKQ